MSREYRVYYIWKNIETGEVRETLYHRPAYEIGDRFGKWEVIDYAEELIDVEEDEV